MTLGLIFFWPRGLGYRPNKLRGAAIGALYFGSTVHHGPIGP